MSNQLYKLRLRRELRDKIYDLFVAETEPTSVAEQYDLTLHKLLVLNRYKTALRKLRFLLSSYKIKTSKLNNETPELRYLLQRTSDSVYKLQGMVSVALEKSKTKEDFSKYFSAILSWDYSNYNYKDVSTDVLINH